MPPRSNATADRNEEFTKRTRYFLDGIEFFEQGETIGLYAKEASRYTEQCIIRLIQSGKVESTLPDRLPADLPGCYAFVVPKGTDPSADFLGPWDPVKVKKWKSKQLDEGKRIFLQQMVNEKHPNIKRMIAFIGDKSGKQLSAYFYQYHVEGENEARASSVMTNTNSTCSSFEDSRSPPINSKLESDEQELENKEKKFASKAEVEKKTPKKKRSQTVGSFQNNRKAPKTASSSKNFVSPNVPTNNQIIKKKATRRSLQEPSSSAQSEAKEEKKEGRSDLTTEPSQPKRSRRSHRSCDNEVAKIEEKTEEEKSHRRTSARLQRMEEEKKKSTETDPEENNEEDKEEKEEYSLDPEVVYKPSLKYYDGNMYLLPPHSSKPIQLNCVTDLGFVYEYCGMEANEDELKAERAKKQREEETSKLQSAETPPPVVEKTPPQISSPPIASIPLPSDCHLNWQQEEINAKRNEMYNRISNFSTNTSDFTRNCMPINYDEYIFTISGIKGLFVPPNKEPTQFYALDSRRVRDMINKGDDWLFKEMPTSLPSKAPGSYIFMVDKRICESAGMGRPLPPDFLAPWESREKDRTNRTRRTSSYDTTKTKGPEGFQTRHIRHSHYLNEDIKRKISYFCHKEDKIAKSHYVFEYKIPPIDGSQASQVAQLENQAQEHPILEETESWEYQENQFHLIDGSVEVDGIVEEWMPEDEGEGYEELMESQVVAESQPQEEEEEVDEKPNIAHLRSLTFEKRPVQVVAPIQKAPEKSHLRMLLDADDTSPIESPPSSSTVTKNCQEPEKTPQKIIKHEKDAEPSVESEVMKIQEEIRRGFQIFHRNMGLVDAKCEELKRKGMTGVVQLHETRKNQLNDELKRIDQELGRSEKRFRAQLDITYMKQHLQSLQPTIRIKQEPVDCFSSPKRVKQEPADE